MQSIKRPSAFEVLLKLGVDEKTAEKVLIEFKKEHLRDPETMGDILEVLE